MLTLAVYGLGEREGTRPLDDEPARRRPAPAVAQPANDGGARRGRWATPAPQRLHEEDGPHDPAVPAGC